MTTREDVVSAARRWVGAPTAHQGRRRDCGCDCVGLLTGIVRDLNLPGTAPSDYCARPDFAVALQECCTQMDRADGVMQPGQVALLRVAGLPHLAVIGRAGYGALTLIHAWAPAASVCEHRIDERWIRRIAARFELRGVDRCN